MKKIKMLNSFSEKEVEFSLKNRIIIEGDKYRIQQIKNVIEGKIRKAFLNKNFATVLIKDIWAITNKTDEELFYELYPTIEFYDP